MFSDLSNLGLKRTGKQAFGFYLAYLVFIIIGAAVIGGIAGVIAGEDDGAFGNGVRLGTIVSIISCITLSFLILRAKKLTSHFGLCLLAITSGILALIGGGVLGIIIPAVFTTKGASSKKKSR